MSYSTSELQDIATDLLKEHVAAFEFSNVYEDEDLEDLTEEEQRAIYMLVLTADIETSWKAAE